MKTITINVPDDCEVRIVRKEEKKEPVIRTYQDLIDNGIELEGFYVTSQSDISHIHGRALKCNRLIATSRKVAKSMLAMAMISQLMPYYGGIINDYEWKQDIYKYVIVKIGNQINKDWFTSKYHFLSFHTAEQRDNFLKYNEQLVKDYLMID